MLILYCNKETFTHNILPYFFLGGGGVGGSIVLCQNGDLGRAISHLPRLHSAPIPGSNPGGGSDQSCGVSLTRFYTVIPLKEQTPQAGQIERAQVRNLSCYT